MTAAFTYHHTARRLGPALVVICVWAALLGAYIYLDATLWIIGLFALFTLPALWDLARNTTAGLTLDDTTLTWQSGRRSATLALDELDHIRLDTRLDFSVRATAFLKTGRKIRLPFEATPPHQAFEDALTARNITVQRYHFQLMQ